MSKIIHVGATSQTRDIYIRDTRTGGGLTGLVFNSAGLIAYYGLTKATPLAITLATQTVTGAWSTGGFVEKDATHMPGWYRFDIPNAAIASGPYTTIHFSGAANMVDCPLEIELTATDDQDGVHFGITALPNTACTTNASLLTSGAGTDQLSVTSGVAKANLAQILGTALTETAGLLAAGFKQFFNIASPTSTMNTITAVTTTTTATNLTNAPTNGDFTATMKASLNASTPASITGAVGSVTGNVGGNVVGSTGSVTGAVGSVTGNVGGNVTGSTGSVAGNVTGSVGSVAGNVAGSVGSISGVTFPTNFGTLSIGGAGHITNVDTLTTYTGDTPQTGDSYARLGAPTGASIAADLAEIEAETDGIASIPTSNPTAIAIATAVWQDATGADFTVSSSAGEQLFSLSGGGGGTDPWLTPLPGSYAPGEAGYILGTSAIQTADVGTLIPATLVMTGGKVWTLDTAGNPLNNLSSTNVTIAATYATPTVAAVTGNIGGNLAGNVLGNVNGSVDSVTNPVSVDQAVSVALPPSNLNSAVLAPK